jgi:hypothetical protein
MLLGPVFSLLASQGKMFARAVMLDFPLESISGPLESLAKVARVEVLNQPDSLHDHNRPGCCDGL